MPQPVSHEAFQDLFPATAPVATAQALTAAYDARDAAIVRAQSLAALVKGNRAALAVLATEAQAAAMAVSAATDAWAAAMCDHVVSVHSAASSIALQCDQEMDEAACDAVLGLDPNAL